MTMIGKPYGYRIEKFCFVFCGPERCDCGALDPFCADSHLYTGNNPVEKLPIEVVPENKEEKSDGEV